MANSQRPDRMTVEEGRLYLGVSRNKMAQLISKNILHAEENPVDRRFKLLDRRELDDLKAQYEGLPRARRKNAA